MVPAAVLTQSKPVSITAVRPVSAIVPKFMVTRPRLAHPIVTKSKSPIRRHITRSQSPKTSNSPPRVIAVQALVVSAAQGTCPIYLNLRSLMVDMLPLEVTPRVVTLLAKERLRQKGKQHRASCKTKPVSSVDQPLFRLHMDLFGPTFVKSLNKKSYCLVVTDDYSRFTWVFFLTTKNETSPILKTFITGLENQLSLKVKVIRSDNGTEFKNHDLNQFCGRKGIKREFSVPRTPQQNGIAERKNRTLIEAIKTMRQIHFYPFHFELRQLILLDMSRIGYSLGKFEGKVDEGFLVGYSVNSKAFRVFNNRTCIVQETLHVNFLENKPNITCSGPKWLFDIDILTRTMNYQPIITGNQTNPSAGFQGKFDAKKEREENDQQYMLFPMWSFGSSNPHNNDEDAAFNEKEHDAKKPNSAQSRKQDDKTKKEAKGKIPTVGQNSLHNTNTVSVDGPSNAAVSPTYGKSSFIDAFQLPDDPDMRELKDITYSDDEDVVGAEADFNNLESSILEEPPSAGFQDKFDAEKEREENDQQYMLFPMWSFGSSNPHNNDEDAAFNEKEHDAKKPKSAVNVSPSSSTQSGKQDDKTKKKAKGKSPVESSTGYRHLSAEFEDCSKNKSNGVNAAGSIVPTVRKNSFNSTNPFSAVGPLNTTTSLTHEKSSFNDASQLPDDLDMPELDDITYFDDENDSAEADFNNLHTSITVSPIPTARLHKDHPVSQIISDLSLTTQTKSMNRVVKDQVGLSQLFDNDFHTCMFACFLSQEEPKRVHQALKDPSWIEAVQEELL
nr:hypothetical protein [Tanacetum cinerariifolium]